MTAASGTGVIRKLWSADVPAFRDHLLRLDVATRCNRFGMMVGDAFVARYAETSFTLDTLLHGVFVDDRLVGVGELRRIGVSRSEAEAAFSVETGHQGQGHGSRLMKQVVLAARNRGIRRLHMNCLASNGRMQRLARRNGAVLDYEGGDVVGLVLPDMASPASCLREAIGDGHGWAMAVVELQKRSFAAGLFGRS